jgi:proteasome lid subunit RPN8/RPN11
VVLRRKKVEGVHRISNAREEEAGRDRFLIRPQEFLAGEHVAAAKGLEIVGFYHSHPDHPPEPSGYDREHAWPVYSYAIVAVIGRQASLLGAGDGSLGLQA